MAGSKDSIELSNFPLFNLKIPGRSVEKTWLEWMSLPVVLRAYIVLGNDGCRVRAMKVYKDDIVAVPVYITDLN